MDGAAFIAAPPFFYLMDLLRMDEVEKGRSVKNTKMDFLHVDLCLRMALKRLKFCRSWVKWKGDRGWKKRQK